MKNRLKFVLLPLLILVLIISFSVADTEVLTMENLIELAQINDVDLAIGQLDIEIADLDYDEAIKQAKLKDYEGGARTERVSKYTIVNITPVKAKTSLMMARYDYDQVKAQIIDEVEVAHEAIVMLNQEIALEEIRLEYMQLKADNGKKQYELGMISYLDYDELMDDLQTQIFTVEELKLDKKNDILDFEFMIGEDLPEDYSFGSEVNLDFEVFNLDILQYQEAFDNDWGVYQATQDLEFAQGKFDTVALYYGDDDKEYKEALLNLKSAQYDNSDALGTFELEYAQMRNDVEILIKKLELYQGYRDIAINEYEINQVKYDLGLISYEDLMEKEVDIEDAEYDFSKIIHEYNLAINETKDYTDYKIADYE
jgi:hypothetical protein